MTTISCKCNITSVCLHLTHKIQSVNVLYFAAVDFKPVLLLSSHDSFAYRVGKKYRCYDNTVYIYIYIYNTVTASK